MFIMIDHGNMVRVITDPQLERILTRAMCEMPLARIVISATYASIGRLDAPEHECFEFRKVGHYGDN